MFIVRRHWNDPKSETIARGTTRNRVIQAAMTFLMENDRDYECFELVETDDAGNVIEIGESVSWEPRG